MSKLALFMARHPHISTASPRPSMPRVERNVSRTKDDVYPYGIEADLEDMRNGMRMVAGFALIVPVLAIVLVWWLYGFR